MIDANVNQDIPDKVKLPYITIHMVQDGNIEVHGEFPNLVLAYGMLQVAQDFFRDSVKNQAQIQRVNGSGGLIAKLRNGRF